MNSANSKYSLVETVQMAALPALPRDGAHKRAVVQNSTLRALTQGRIFLAVVALEILRKYVWQPRRYVAPSK